MNHRHVVTHHGFTLVELITVIAIISLLIALLLPALSAAKAASRQMVCASKVRQISQAALVYSIDHRNRSIMSMPHHPVYPSPYFNWQHLLASKGYIHSDWTGLGKDKASVTFACPSEDASSTFNPRFAEPAAQNWRYQWNGTHYAMNFYLSVVHQRKNATAVSTARLDRIPKPAWCYLVSDYNGHYDNIIAYHTNPDTDPQAINIERHPAGAAMSFLDGRVNFLDRQTVVVGSAVALPGFPPTSLARRDAAWFGE